MSSNKSYFRTITMSFAGNALEFYDFTLYGVFAMKMGQVFFPLEDPLISLIASLGAFASGFLMRPIGALIFGSLGDKYGRKTALTVSIIGIGFPTVAIGLTPGYEEIGILAPIIVVCSRLIQGLCTGGEYNGAAIYCLEQIGNTRPGFYSAFLTSSCALGAITALLLGGFFSNQDWEGAWRVPFILGFFISFVGLWLRYRIEESMEFKAKASSEGPIPLLALFREYKVSCIKTFSLGFLNGTMSYTVFSFLIIFLKRYGSLPDGINVVYVNMVGMAFFMIGNPIMGHVYDRVGEKTYILIMTIMISVMPIVAFYLLGFPSLWLVFLAQAILGLATGAIGGVTHAIPQTLFPTLIRYRGIAFNFSFGVGIGGGAVGIAHLYLIEKTGWIYIPSAYILLVTLIVYLVFRIADNKQPEPHRVV
jgi:MFS transporter, MHS family, proline/betaine transporter